MGRPPCCDKANVKRGLWTAEEDAKILAYVSKHGTGNWTLVPKKAGLNRCGKSCRLRWTNYLRPDLKHESFSPEEEQLIINLHQLFGSRWSFIAKSLPGRTDNDVKNYWNTKLRKKLMKMGIDPITHKPIAQIMSDYTTISAAGNLPNYNLSTTQFQTSIGPHFNHLIGNPNEANRTFYGLPSWNLLQSPSAVTSMHLSSPEPTPFGPFQAQMGAYPNPHGYTTFVKTTLEPELVPKQEGGLVTQVNQCEPSNLSSNGDAFVDALLDEDSRIQSEIGDLLDGILDY